MSKIIDLLKEFGLSTNSAKAYMALLKRNPATGYEISTQSGIPRSAVYTILNKLELIGIVNSIGDSPKKYIPLAASALLDHFEYSHKHRIQELKENIEKEDISDESFDFWHLHGYRNLILRIKETIKNSEETLVISIWNREMKLIKKELNISFFDFVWLFGSDLLYETLNSNSKDSLPSPKCNSLDLSVIVPPPSCLIAK